MVDKAVAYLKSTVVSENRTGARALQGLALLKSGSSVEPSHPAIAKAVAAIQKVVTGREPKNITTEALDIYSTGLSIIFLVTLDPSKYRPEIDSLLESLWMRQKRHGGWGYAQRDTGDTSMTQYGVLSSWEAKNAGVTIRMEAIESVTQWLLKTQDPSGAYGYQGKPSDGAGLVKQDGVRISMAAAGLGSLLISADLLGLSARGTEREDGLPAALKEVKAAGQEARKPKTRISSRSIQEAQSRGARWFTENYTIEPGRWPHYYLYALERYMSFREKALGKKEEEPKWYNDGVEYLMRTQKGNGEWQGDSGPIPDTGFAVLFLVRSTEKSIQKAQNLGGGRLIVGRGLPKDTDQAVIHAGNVVPRPLLGPAEQLLAVLESSGKGDYDQTLASLADVPLPEMEGLISKHAAKLRKMATDPSAEARLTAIAALGRGRNLEHVPTLIFALGDADPRIVREARDALERISRKPIGFGPPDEPTDVQRREAIAKWKSWYLAIRPDAVFD